MNLPQWVSQALAAKLEGVSRKELAASAERLSANYRAHGGSTVIRSAQDALAYSLVRMPATFAAVRHALGQAADRLPEFAPHSLLDVGAGPGTASWAAVDVWPSLTNFTLLDQNPSLLAIARTVGASLGSAQIQLTEASIPAAFQSAPSADLVVASYAFAEFPQTALADLLVKLWPRAAQMLVLVEPGTPEGFRRILACRDWLLAAGAHIAAPCTHAGPCPLAREERWCHFNQRLSRSRDHQLVKSAEVNYEDEKLSYLVAMRSPLPASNKRRILSTPYVSKAHAAVTLCAPEQVELKRIARSEKSAYKAARRADWGDAIDFSTSALPEDGEL